jgi:hypothetical protein
MQDEQHRLHMIARDLEGQQPNLPCLVDGQLGLRVDLPRG